MRKLAIACISFSAAIFVSNYILPVSVLPFLTAALILLGVYFIARPAKFLRGITITVFALAVGFGVFYAHYQNTAARVDKLAGVTMDINAKLISYPVSYEDYCRAEIKLKTEGLPAFKAILYDNSMALTEAEPGDRISFKGKLSSAGIRYGEAYDNYFSKDIYFIINTKSDATIDKNVLDFSVFPQRFNRVVTEHISKIFPEDISPFIKSLMLGNKTELYEVPGQYNSLTRAGLSHVVAVSGMHIAYLLAFLQLIFGRGRKSALACIVLVWIFVFVSGASPSAVRAGVMQSIFMLAPVFKRENDTLTTISFALSVILAANPFSCASISLQLSFSAMAGILAYSRKFSDAIRSVLPLKESAIIRKIAETAGTSTAGMIFTVPLVAIHFGTVNVLSVLSNVLSLWAVSLCFIGAYAACAVALISVKLGTALAWLISWPIRYVLLVAELVSSVSFSTIYLVSEASAAWIVLSYVVLFICLFSKLSSAQKMFIPMGISAVLLFSLSVVTRHSYNSADAVYTAIDVGQGQSISVMSDEETVLIDCGGIGSLDNAGEVVGAYLNSCGRKDVDVLILTHLHSDHANGVEALMEMTPVRKIIMPENPNDDDGILDEVLRAVQRQGTEINYVSVKNSMQLGALDIKLWQPQNVGDINERGLIVHVSSGDYDLLVTGDASSSVERRLVSEGEIKDVELLIAGHHGSRYSSCGDFLEYISGETAIISTGYNTYGHPTHETLARLEAYGYNIFRTDLNGNIEIRLG